MLFRAVDITVERLNKIFGKNVRVSTEMPDLNSRVVTPAVTVRPLSFTIEDHVRGFKVKTKEYISISVVVRNGDNIGATDILTKCVIEIANREFTGYVGFSEIERNNPVNAIRGYDIYTTIFSVSQILTTDKEVI